MAAAVEDEIFGDGGVEEDAAEGEVIKVGVVVEGTADEQLEGKGLGCELLEAEAIWEESSS